MYHSITFGEKNTWDDWHLIPSSRPVFNPPVFREKFIDIPGVSGLLDLSTIFSGEPIYGSRIGSLEFIIANDYWTREVACATIMEYIHGKRVQATLEDDPDYYYEGLFFISDWGPGRNNSIIKIDYNVSPYKRDRFSTKDDWEWDLFDFETGLIKNYLDYQNITIDGELTPVVVEGSHKQISLEFTWVSANAGLIGFNGDDFVLPIGASVISGLAMLEGENTLYVTGVGTLSIDYRGGSL